MADAERALADMSKQQLASAAHSEQLRTQLKQLRAKHEAMADAVGMCSYITRYFSRISFQLHSD